MCSTKGAISMIFYCLKAQNYHNTSAGMLTWLLMTTNDSVIALPGVGISGGQTSLAGRFFCFGTNTPWLSIFWDMADLLHSHFWIAQLQRMVIVPVSYYMLYPSQKANVKEVLVEFGLTVTGFIVAARLILRNRRSPHMPEFTEWLKLWQRLLPLKILSPRKWRPKKNYWNMADLPGLY